MVDRTRTSKTEIGARCDQSRAPHRNHPVSARICDLKAESQAVSHAAILSAIGRRKRWNSSRANGRRPASATCPFYRCGVRLSERILKYREDSMANELAALSQELAGAVEAASKHVVAIHARPRFSSSGVFWRPGVIVTAEHTLRREEDITVTLPDGRTSRQPSPAPTQVPISPCCGWRAPARTPPAATSIVPGHVALSIGRSQDSGSTPVWGS